MKTYTIFCDIDGTLIPQLEKLEKLCDPESYENFNEQIVSARRKLLEWHDLGYKVILTTGRPEGWRHGTVNVLEKLGFIYDQLVMNCGNGPRVVINDITTETGDKAFSLNIDRNRGIGDINVQTL